MRMVKGVRDLFQRRVWELLCYLRTLRRCMQEIEIKASGFEAINPNAADGSRSVKSEPASWVAELILPASNGGHHE